MKLVYIDWTDLDERKTTYVFKNEDELLALAKDKFFNPKDPDYGSWYDPEYGGEEGREIEDFEKFKAEGKFDFDDGRNILGTLKIEK